MNCQRRLPPRLNLRLSCLFDDWIASLHPDSSFQDGAEQLRVL
jgi:hypothetical protein